MNKQSRMFVYLGWFSALVSAYCTVAIVGVSIAAILHVVGIYKEVAHLRVQGFRAYLYGTSFLFATTASFAMICAVVWIISIREFGTLNEVLASSQGTTRIAVGNRQ